MILTTTNDNRRRCCIPAAFFNIVRAVLNIYDGDSIQNVGWQTVGKLTSSNSGISDYILQICLPKPNFPLQSSSFLTPRDERPCNDKKHIQQLRLSGSRFAGFDVHTESTKSVYIHRAVRCADNFVSSHSDTDRHKQPAKMKKYFQSMSVSDGSRCVLQMKVWLGEEKKKKKHVCLICFKISAKNWSSPLACRVTSLYSSPSQAKLC